MPEVIPLLKLLADDNRLRLLALLDGEELSVQELTRVTGLGQSRVSHHLALLRQAGVIEDRREGSYTFCRLRPRGGGNPLGAALWREVGGAFRRGETAAADRARLAELREERRAARRAAHDRLAGVWGGVGEDVERGSLRSEAVASLVPRSRVVADLGCGAGFLTRFLAARFDRVIAVDHSEAMLAAARVSVGPAAPVEWRAGELEALPIDDGEVDAVFANLALGHVGDLAAVARECARVLRPGGAAVITDLRPHGEEWMRDELAAERLGIPPEEVARALVEAGFGAVEEMAIEDRYRMRSASGRVARLGLFLVRGFLGPGS